MRTVTVVGASLAGLSAARALRSQEFAGRIVVIGEETHEPYDRPPLSKDFLEGTTQVDEIALTTADDKLLDIDWRLGSTATELDPAERAIVLSTGERIVTDGVILATGARARPMPGPAGVHTLRTLDDAIALRAALREGGAVVVIGAGFIGAEVASTARKLGLDVTVVETLPTPMAGPLGTDMGQLCGELHGQNGVSLITGVAVGKVIGDSVVKAVQLADGREIPTDIVVAGIGAVPNVEWLAGSGVKINGGVVTDARCMTNIPSVVAVGDCASSFNDHAKAEIRLEHWTNALQQPRVAVATLLGRTSVHAARFSVPYFWSDQYGSRLQFAGHRRDGDQVEVVEGVAGSSSFVAVYRRGERPVAVLAINEPRAFARWRLELSATGGVSS